MEKGKEVESVSARPTHLDDSLPELEFRVKGFVQSCVNKAVRSPLTPKLKCPHGRGEDTHGAKGVTSVAFDEDESVPDRQSLLPKVIIQSL
jgi:hypothetical protein